jgi:hypothetical protein
MSFAGGVSFADPDSGTAPPSDPSAASQEAPPGTKADSVGGDSISISDMFEMQAMMDHLNQLSEMSSAVMSESNSALAGMAQKVKE